MWAATLHLMPRLDVIGYAFVDSSIGLMLAALLWLLYSPSSPRCGRAGRILWSRGTGYLAGQFGDPRLGSHILLGVVIGLAM